MTPKYTELQKENARLEKKEQALSTLRLANLKALAAARKEFVLTMTCGHDVRVGDIELISQDSGCYDTYSECWESSIREYYACPECDIVYAAPKDKALFPDGFAPCCAVVHRWVGSARYTAPTRVVELMAPSWDREKEIRESQERARAVAAARALLAAEEKRTRTP